MKKFLFKTIKKKLTSIFVAAAVTFGILAISETKLDVKAAFTAPYYNINDNGGSWDGNNYILDGNVVKDAFFCDGTYTYFLQADGTPMKDRLTYHPDGKHVIYFDEEGHEVFSNFANVKKSISGDTVDDLCFFDVYGYMYVNFLTFNKDGSALYYANPYGVMECSGWFQFAGNAGYVADTFGIEEGTWGYAYSDGSIDTKSIGDEVVKSTFVPDVDDNTCKHVWIEQTEVIHHDAIGHYGRVYKDFRDDTGEELSIDDINAGVVCINKYEREWDLNKNDIEFRRNPYTDVTFGYKGTGYTQFDGTESDGYVFAYKIDEISGIICQNCKEKFYNDDCWDKTYITFYTTPDYSESSLEWIKKCCKDENIQLIMRMDENFFEYYNYNPGWGSDYKIREDFNKDEYPLDHTEKFIENLRQPCWSRILYADADVMVYRGWAAGIEEHSESKKGSNCYMSNTANAHKYVYTTVTHYEGEEFIIDTPAWDETTVTGYKCSKCGKTK